VTTLAATGVSSTSATLRADVNPHGTKVGVCDFDIYQGQVLFSSVRCQPAPGSGNASVRVTYTFSDFSPGTTYRDRFVAANRNPNLIYGKFVEFTTTAAAAG
jgi:hypothetical protein